MMLLLLTPGHHGCEGGYFTIVIAGPRSSQLPACCCLCVTIVIAIDIVGSRSGCSCCCCCGVLIAVVGSCFPGYIWREERVGKALDSGHVDVVVDDKGLSPVRVPRNCKSTDRVPVVVAAVVVFRLSLPLSDHVLVVVAVVFQVHLEGRTSR